jgi:ataxin-3
MRAQQEYAQRELLAETPDAAAMDARRRERQQEEEEEEELLRRAIEESEAMARAEGHTHNADDEDMDIEPRDPQTARFDGFQTMRHTVTDRVYDDDDAELQAALKASLEHVPEGWELPQLPLHQMPAPTSAISSTPDPEISNQNTDREQERDEDDAESVLSDKTSTSVTDNTVSDAPVEPVSVDELRKKRLARFGA